MKWKSVGVFMAIALGVILLFGIGVSKAATRNLSWFPVTSYNDNTPIEAGNAVTYSAWMQDSVTGQVAQLANRISLTSVTFSDSLLTKGRVYNFVVQAQLATGGASDNSAVYAWAVPLGRAATPSGLAVQ
jgi:hypothetical protein